MPERITREQPLATYRIVQRHGNGKATIEYADDRASAQQHAIDVGGDVVIEEYVEGKGWEPIKGAKK